MTAFAVRRAAAGCQAMRDEDGRAMLDELAAQVQQLGAHVATVADALELLTARTSDAAELI